MTSAANDVMWKIQRVRLDRIGPSAARFLDVTLDLRDAGGHPLDTIVWLRNGGGKSTVLSLICALFRPHRRDFLATAATGKHLEDYVLGADTAHVVVEWSGPSGRRLVTGAVYEWADRTQPADPNRDHDRLHARWYVFTPADGRAELDLLPFETGGSPTGLRDFVAEIRKWDAIPGCDAAVTDGMDRWRRLLDDHGLDPEIFTPLLQMNATEGGIEGQFQFRNADQFVQYLLELIVDPDVSARVSQILEGVRAGLAERPELLADLTFADEAAPRLRSLATARDERAVATAALSAQESRARALLAALEAAAVQADREQESRATGAAAQERAAAEHAASESGSREVAIALRRVAAGMRLAAAEATGAQLAQQESQLTAALAAWQATPAVHALREAEQRTVQLEEQLVAATQDAEPLRVRRDEAAAGYAVALDASITALDEQVAQRRDDAEVELEQEAAARKRGEDALAERAQLAASLTTAQQALAALDRDLDAAVTDGHLGRGEDVDAATQRHRNADETAVADLARIVEERGVLGAERRRLQERLTAVGTERAAVHKQRTDTAQQRGDLAERVAELAADERLRALGGGEDIDPLAEAGDLADAVSHAIARTHRRRIELAVVGAEDERALAALAATELLPGSLDLVRAHDALERAGIPATSGWRYLADAVPAARHAAVLRAAPALATGLLVHEPRDLPAARDAVTGAGIRPTSAVVVATTAELAAIVTSVEVVPDASPFLVPPAPALTDRAAAGAELTARERSRAERSGLDADLAAALDHDTDLLRRLRQLAADCPPGTREALALAEGQATERLAELAAAEAEAQEAGAALAGRESALDEARAEAERTRRAAASALGVLTGLATREQDASAHRESVATLPAAIAACARTLAAETDAEATHRRLAGTAAEHAATIARTAQGQRGDRAALGEPAGAAHPASSDLTVSEARAAWESASLAYRREVSDSALASSLQEATRAVERLRDQLAAVPAAVRSAARTLLDTPDGLDAGARGAALARAEAARSHAAAALADARAETRMARAELTALGTGTDPIGEPPATREDALAAAERADREADAHRGRHDVAVAAVAAAAAEQAVSRERATGLRHLVELITLPEQASGSAPVTAPAFTGTVEEARAALDATRSAWDTASTDARRSLRAVEKLAQELALWAAADRFAGVKPAVRDRFRTDDVGRDLLPDAERLADDLDLFAVQLRQRLEELEEHKSVVVTAMVGMVRQALKSLSRAQSLSELPESLGEWAGQKFLEVGPRAMVETADAVLRDRCARLVDSLTTRGTPVPRGQELLWQATSAVVGEGNWKAKVLKPSTTFAVERVSVERMRKWSGGEKVTISLLLFCMVAKLRATTRGRELPGLGALPLDNPLGKANYVVFLNLQRKVAAANGIQLIFLTGVGDMKAVGRFPNVIRMRNTRTKAREYVSIADRQVAAVDPAGIVDTTRVWREDPVLTLL
ncbi:hypothetical protein [Pseudonocardia sp. GCM10023141]|uniref:hypothetical protein n=1 Tax=Pseudonocardia sp. GCM10023141 TaxID=3252653 RepID=UPI0036179E79